MSTKKHKEPEDIFVSGKKSWNELYGGALAMAAFWRLTTLLTIVVCVVLAGGVIWSTRQSHIVPYVVEVNKLGKAMPVTRATRETGVTKVILTHEVGSFINDVRGLVSDPVAEQAALKKVYAHLIENSPAYNAVSAYLQQRSKAIQNNSVSFSVHISGVLWKSENTALVQWEETAWQPSGQNSPAGRYEAYITVKVVPPPDESTPGFKHNPLGIYIDKISWTQVQ